MTHEIAQSAAGRVLDLVEMHGGEDPCLMTSFDAEEIEVSIFFRPRTAHPDLGAALWRFATEWGLGEGMVKGWMQDGHVAVVLR